ncbi:sigma 54-interacting transcriptional regulator [Kiritimatiella glycovorans]|uniref:Nif-specific regulatory protein n=1 Tax=Kiritimatiella glycovorans TaxID=1307763 RepID=A0A0G3EE06_9BACT|nr:sigma 54-interacting transcriptional regulator [Kiritimatiella glycovorans]AKJ64543.1 Nif-specific regulatory protein [Kiritimatiella glycovorans]
MVKEEQIELEVLYRISQAVTGQASGVKELLGEVLDIMESEMQVSRSTLTLRRPDSDIFVIEASHGLSSRERGRGQYRLGEGITGQVAQTGKPAVIPNASKEPSFLDRTRARGSAPVAFICVPIVHNKQVIGTMSVDLTTRAHHEDLQRYLRFLELVANVLAEAVANMREEKEEREGLLAENERLRRQLGDRYSLDNIVGNCHTMRQVYEQIAQVAESPANVLIRGESGTGKELVARAVHYNSSRANNPFISVNCAALPQNLVESELFGHEKGSFTGATSERKGRFELADSGTIFLDEIGDIDLAVQVRLLRVLQERTFERVGGTKSLEVNVRVIAATSRDLEHAISDGGFREDLYYRLNVFPIFLPPLRERRSDIMLLADHFLQKYSERYGKQIKRISTSAINMMMAYHWPGNVRELENCIERAVLTSSDDVVHGYNLPPSLQTSERTQTDLLPEEGADLKTMVASYEKEILIDALKKHRGNAAAAARYLNTTQRIINYRIRQLGIDAKQYR